MAACSSSLTSVQSAALCAAPNPPATPPITPPTAAPTAVPNTGTTLPIRAPAAAPANAPPIPAVFAFSARALSAAANLPISCICFCNSGVPPPFPTCPNASCCFFCAAFADSLKPETTYCIAVRPAPTPARIPVNLPNPF